MKTVEFKRAIEKYEGCMVYKGSYKSSESSDFGLYVCFGSVPVIFISLKIDNEMSVLRPGIPDWLFDTAVTYAETSINDRKEEQLGYIPSGDDDGNGCGARKG